MKTVYDIKAKYDIDTMLKVAAEAARERDEREKAQDRRNLARIKYASARRVSRLRVW